MCFVFMVWTFEELRVLLAGAGFLVHFPLIPCIMCRNWTSLHWIEIPLFAEEIHFLCCTMKQSSSLLASLRVKVRTLHHPCSATDLLLCISKVLFCESVLFQAGRCRWQTKACCFLTFLQPCLIASEVSDACRHQVAVPVRA